MGGLGEGRIGHKNDQDALTNRTVSYYCNKIVMVFRDAV